MAVSHDNDFEDPEEVLLRNVVERVTEASDDLEAIRSLLALALTDTPAGKNVRRAAVAYARGARFPE